MIVFAPFLALGLAAGVTLSPTAPTTTISLSDANRQTCGLVLRNATPKPVQTWSVGFWQNHLLTMRDAAGKPVTRTALGKNGSKLFRSPDNDQHSPIIVEPGKSYKYATPSLPTVYVLHPGAYTLTVLYEDKSFGKGLHLSCRMRVTVVK